MFKMLKIFWLWTRKAYKTLLILQGSYFIYPLLSRVLPPFCTLLYIFFNRHLIFSMHFWKVLELVGTNSEHHFLWVPLSVWPRKRETQPFFVCANMRGQNSRRALPMSDARWYLCETRMHVCKTMITHVPVHPPTTTDTPNLTTVDTPKKFNTSQRSTIQLH